MPDIGRCALHFKRPSARAPIGPAHLVALVIVASGFSFDAAAAQSEVSSMGLPETLNRAANSVQAQDCSAAAKQMKRAQEYVKANSVVDQQSLEQMGFVLKDIAYCYFAKGQKAQGEQAGSDAIALFKSSLRGNVLDAGSYNGMGDIYLQREDYTRAVNEFELAIHLVPDYTFAWHDLVLTLYSQYQKAGKPDEETLGRLLRALKRLEELQRTAAQRVPADHWENIKQIKAWALEESAKLTTTKN